MKQYRTLDDLATLSAAKNDPVAFVSSIRGPVTVDEVQRVPELLLAIKQRVAEDRTRGRFLLTGSAEVRVGGAAAESLESRDGSACGVDIKFGATIRSEDFGRLRDLREVAGSKFRGGYILSSGNDVTSVAPDLHALPVTALC